MSLAPLPEARHRRLRALMTRGMRDKYHEFIVEGRRTVAEALASDWSVEYLCVSQSGRTHLDILPAVACPTYIVSDAGFEDFTTTEHSQGIVAVVHERAQTGVEWDSGLVVVLDRLSDPGNVGTIIRTADWFGAKGVVLGTGSAELYNPKTIRSTMGSLFHLPVVTNISLASWCAEMQEKEFTVLCADMAGTRVDATMRNSERMLLVVGSEAHGVDTALRGIADSLIGVPRVGRAESLNAASATAALLALLRA